MADTPTTTNTAATLGATVLGGLFSAAVDSAQAAITVDVPFLGLPGFKQLLGLALGYVAGKMQKPLAALVVDGTISVQIAEEKSGANSATSALLTAQQSGDPNAVTQAQTNFENAFANLGHFDGSVKS